MTGPIVLIDSHSLLHRAHHALPAMNTSRGEPTGALYGMSSLLCKLVRERRPAGIGLAFDAGARRRRAVEPGYKASRPPLPSDLAVQLGRARDLCEAIGAPVLRVDGEEADDVLATAAAVAAGAGSDVLVVTGDRDLLQTIGPRVRVVFIGRRGGPHVDYDQAAVEKQYGVAPHQLPSLRAFLGDPADELPGVPGVGPRTAARWVTAHRDIAGLLAAVDSLAPTHLRPVVQAHADQLRRVEWLGRLSTDLALGEGPHHAPWNAAAAAGLRRWFEELEFRSLVTRLEAIAPPG
ncbi:MAG TPA: 5'-3' exonuclease [Kofleriaceae bacterium]|nr:5'-3' exonuclease [Kofleriaceae bacterium]